MADEVIASPFDFQLLIDRVLRESKSIHSEKVKQSLEKFAVECFEIGFKAGKRPENHPKYKIGV